MKYIFAFIYLLCSSLVPFAQCTGNGLQVFPQGPTIRQNAIFVLDATENSQAIIAELNKKYPIYLRSGRKKVKLVVEEVLKGQYNTSQARLIPKKQLEVGREYELVIDNLPKSDSIGRFNAVTHKFEPIRYKVIEGLDADKPVITSKPKAKNSTGINGLGGYFSFVNFNVAYSDSSEIIVKTTVKDLHTGLETTYYLQPQDNLISVGRNPCSGALTYEEGHDYEIEFSFLDSAGNITVWEGDRIKFMAPVSKLSDY